MTYDQLMDYVCDHKGCVIGTGPVTAMACEAAGFDMMVAYPFVEEGDFMPLNLHVNSVLPRKIPTTDQFQWLKKFMRMAKVRRLR